MGRALRFLALVGALLGPVPALACPACAGRDDGGAKTAYLLGSMILLPFGVAGVVLRVLRRVEQDDA